MYILNTLCNKLCYISQYQAILLGDLKSRMFTLLPVILWITNSKEDFLQNFRVRSFATGISQKFLTRQFWHYFYIMSLLHRYSLPRMGEDIDLYDLLLGFQLKSCNNNKTYLVLKSVGMLILVLQYDHFSYMINNNKNNLERELFLFKINF